MKNVFKAIITFTLAMAMAMCATAPVYAVEYEIGESLENVANDIMASARSNSYPYPAPGSTLSTSTSWKKIASSTTGFNCNVYIKCMNTVINDWGVIPCDIRMLGKNGNVLWSESGAIHGFGDRIFVCGSDVYEIQIRTQAGVGTAYAYETTNQPT